MVSRLLFSNSVTPDVLKTVGSVKSGWKAPSNIAIVKYWGKRENQIPQNPSLSFSLTECFTETTAAFAYDDNGYGLLVNGDGNHPFCEKLNDFFGKVTPFFPFLAQARVEIETKNSFPHSVGIASSASAFASVALCLCHVEQQLLGNEGFGSSFLQKASYIARLGSGSASRSVFGGWQEWGHLAELPNSTNDFAIPVTPNIDPRFLGMRDAVLVVSTEPKELLSTQGHALMVDHPFADARYAEAKLCLNAILKTLRKGDFPKFFALCENEALTLHALMMSSKSSPIFLKPESLSIIAAIRNFRTTSGISVGFTIDAGPNIHLLYHEDNEVVVKAFVESVLKRYCEKEMVIYDRCGAGPERIL
jgi:Mevalonate pyrophosphate decarboxylase